AVKDRELAKLRTDVVRLESESATNRTEVDRSARRSSTRGPRSRSSSPSRGAPLERPPPPRTSPPPPRPPRPPQSLPPPPPPTPARAQAPASPPAAASPQAPPSPPAAASPQMAASAERVTGDRVVLATSDRVTIIGRVVAGAGLSSFTVNGREEKVDNTNIFRAQLAVKKPQERVRIVAVDRSGRK